MHLIRAIDLKLSSEERKRISLLFVDRPGWIWGYRQDRKRNRKTCLQMNLESVHEVTQLWEQTLQALVEAHVGEPLRVLRQYANGQTTDSSETVHQDAKQGGMYTVLVYAHPRWHINWGGETIFFDEDGEVVFATLPRPFRCVLFDARIRHVGREPTRACPTMRVSIAYKLATNSC